MNSTTISQSTDTASGLNQYLTFSVRTVTCAVPVAHAQTVLEAPKITPIPGMPLGMQGVIDFRGMTIPVIDPASLLFTKDHQQSRDEHTAANTHVIVLETERGGEPFIFAAIVDQVDEVIDIAPELLTTGADLQYGLDYTAVSAIARLDATMVIMLSVEGIVGEAGLERKR